MKYLLLTVLLTGCGHPLIRASLPPPERQTLRAMQEPTVMKNTMILREYRTVTGREWHAVSK